MAITKIQPVLPVNFDRPIGQIWPTQPNGALNAVPIPMGQVFIFPEFLVPKTGDDELSLSSLANTIYVTAREHNMSLGSYGHLDPVKFVLAATYLALMAEEVRRDISVLGRFQFGNRNMGETFSQAFTRTPLSTNLGGLPGYVTRLNAVIARINQLYVPTLTILGRWLPHRCYIYKDDEGERFQYYAYRLANYYHLDVTASSPTLGQLLCEFIATTSIANRLTLIEGLLSEYETDDDFVNFAVESSKAGMPRIQLHYVSTSTDGIVQPEFKEKFDVADVFSLENAYFVNPIVAKTHINFLLTNTLTWDVVEDTATGKFIVGRMGNVKNKLPVVNPWSGITTRSNITVSADTSSIDPVSVRPIFSHARHSSEEGLSTWTRYIAACAGTPVSITSCGPTQATWYIDADTGKLDLTGNIYGNPLISALATHSDCILGRPVAYYADATGTVQKNFVCVSGCYVEFQDMSLFAAFFAGFKGKPYVYAIDAQNGDGYPLYHDYDYVVYLQDSVLNLFNASMLWNSFDLLGSVGAGSAEGASKERKSKRPKK